VQSPTPTRSGRPKDTAKRAAIIAAARSLFTRQPFDMVTMEMVAVQAGVSKMTVYSHFRDKEALFESVVSSISDHMLGELAEPQCHCGGLRDRLTALGNRFLGVILDPDTTCMAHTLPGVLRDNPALATRFYDAGPGRVRAALTAMIAAAADRGELSVDDPAWAADDLVSLWEGSLPAKLAFALVRPVTREEITRRARRGTEVFLRAYAPVSMAATVRSR
jgi:TetR/AcrR family transcriptional regulator, mexJK operon transcriptional repressor